MEKFTSSKKKNIKAIQQENTTPEITYKVELLIYVKDEGHILMQSEEYLSCISLIVQNNNPALSIKQNLLENGIILNQFYQYDIEGPFYISKDSKDIYYTC